MREMGGQFVCSKVCVIMEVTMCDLFKEREGGRIRKNWLQTTFKMNGRHMLSLHQS